MKVIADSPSFVNCTWKADVDGERGEFPTIQEMAAFVYEQARVSTMLEVLEALGFHGTRHDATIDAIVVHARWCKQRESGSHLSDVARRLNAIGIAADLSPEHIVERVSAHIGEQRDRARRSAENAIWTDVANRIFPPGTAVEFESSLGVPQGTTLRRVVASGPKNCGDDEVCVDLVDDTAWVPVRLLRRVDAMSAHRLSELLVQIDNRDAEIATLRSASTDDSDRATHADLRQLEADLCVPIRALNRRIAELEAKVNGG